MAGRKSNLRQFHSIVAAVMGTGTITSPITCTQWLDNIGIQLNWTGSPVGAFAIQVSADYAQDMNGMVQNPGHWVNLILTYYTAGAFTSSPTVPTTVGSPIYLDLNQLSTPWIRVQYIGASGAGVLDAYVTAKEV
jgi:hypothetical protein